MPKAAVVNLQFENEAERVKLKRLSLLFDEILIEEFPLVRAKHLPSEFYKLNSMAILSQEELHSYISEVEWLIDKGIVKTFTMDRLSVNIDEGNRRLLEDISENNKQIQNNLFPVEASVNREPFKVSNEVEFVGTLLMTKELKDNIEDIGVRMDSLYLSNKESHKEFVPVLNSFNSYTKKELSKDAAIHFVLDKIPIPNLSTTWEQILEFRSDENVKRKYYALINWINEMSISNMPISHIADKYNYLHSEYTKQYSLHKMKSNLTKVELLVLGGMELITLILSQNYSSAFRNLLNIGKQNVLLMEGESKLHGREIAYIHCANERFS
jgi:hypothetical protein